MAEEKTLNADEQMKALGHDPGLVDGELREDDPANVPPSPEEGDDSGLDQQEEEEQVAQQDQPGLDSEEQEEEQQEADDQNDKTWQSRADKAEAERQKIAEENQRIQAERDALIAVMQGTGALNQGGPTQAPKEEKEPELWDFIKQEDFESFEANDPRTPSGQAQLKFQRALRKYETQQSMREYEISQRQQQQQAVAKKQASKLAEKYVEFRNPLTGAPNMDKIAGFFDEMSNSEDEDFWVDLYGFIKQRKSGKPTQQQGPQANLQDIGKRANKAQPVGSQSASEQQKKTPPKSVNQYTKYFGAGFEIPADAEVE